MVTTAAASRCANVIARWTCAVTAPRQPLRRVPEPVSIPLGSTRSGQASRISTTSGARSERARTTPAPMEGMPGTVARTTSGRRPRPDRCSVPRAAACAAVTA
ncbi:hypothetical protein REH70_16325 [Cellulomonas sp. ATA003]|nr:hypothetical protein [Cellulomonas sp. ATA003]WNB85183.1 hypothetical protein REH70_16325 [Cellulomonas sp. ATA003]